VDALFSTLKPASSIHISHCVYLTDYLLQSDSRCNLSPQDRTFEVTEADIVETGRMQYLSSNNVTALKTTIRIQLYSSWINDSNETAHEEETRKT